MVVDITPNILESDARNFPCVALAIKAQGGNYDSVLIQQGKQTYVYSIGSSGNTASKSFELDEPMSEICARMQDATKEMMPHLRETLFKYDGINNIIFLDSKEMSLNDIVKKA